MAYSMSTQKQNFQTNEAIGLLAEVNLGKSDKKIKDSDTFLENNNGINSAGEGDSGMDKSDND